jgi:hypothetical protein
LPKAICIQKEQVKLYQEGRRRRRRRNLGALAQDLESKNRDLDDERLRRKIEAPDCRKQTDGRPLRASAPPSRIT